MVNSEIAMDGRRTDKSADLARVGRPALGRPALDSRAIGRPEVARPGLEAATHPYEAYHRDNIPEVRNYLQAAPEPLRPVGGAALPRLDDRAIRGNAVRDRIAVDHPYRNDLFTQDFWGLHPSYYPLARNANVWRAATWYGVRNWLADPIVGDPLYYDNGYGYPQTQDPEEDGSGQIYTQQAEQSTTADESGEYASGQWIPLGVFAVTKEAKDAPSPTMYMQLALNRSGAIGGNLYDSTYNKTFPLVGEVDKKNQRAVWKMAHSKNTPIIETGLYNLTRDETPVKFTFADGSTQEFFLVKIHEGQNSPDQE